MAEEIVTDRLVLRRATGADTADMHQILSNPVAMTYWSTLPHTDLAQTEAWMASMIDASPAISDDFIVTLDGATIGKLGCWRLPEIGFILEPAVWGHGYASEALAAFIDRRRAAGGKELIADVDPRNRSSLRLLSSVGFEETGRAERSYRLGDEWCDSIYLRLDLTQA